MVWRCHCHWILHKTCGLDIRRRKGCCRDFLHWQHVVGHQHSGSLPSLCWICLLSWDVLRVHLRLSALLNYKFSFISLEVKNYVEWFTTQAEEASLKFIYLLNLGHPTCRQISFSHLNHSIQNFLFQTSKHGLHFVSKKKVFNIILCDIIDLLYMMLPNCLVLPSSNSHSPMAFHRTI